MLAVGIDYIGEHISLNKDLHIEFNVVRVQSTNRLVIWPDG